MLPGLREAMDMARELLDAIRELTAELRAHRRDKVS